MDILTVISLVLFLLPLVYNSFRLRFRPFNSIDAVLWMGLVVGILPLLFDMIPLVFTSSWLNRFETEKFFSSSALLLLLIVLSVDQTEQSIPSQLKKLTLIVTLLTIISAILFLIFDSTGFWISTIIVYDVLGLMTAVIVTRYTHTHLKYTSLTLGIAFILSFAIFFNEIIFLVAVILYMISVFGIEMLLLSSQRSNHDAKGVT